MFIRSDMLKPFDVILTRPKKNIVSSTIASLTSGPYSHAAIVIGKTVRFESVGLGMKYTPVKFSKCGRNGNDKYYLEDISAYKQFKVLRHPSIDRLGQEQLQELQERLVEVSSLLNYYEYPNLDVFTTLFTSDTVKDKLLRVAIPVLSNLQKKKTRPGYFCSELVSVIYEIFGLGLFEDQKEHKQVSPNDLAIKSNLKEVPGLTITDDKETIESDPLILNTANNIPLILRFLESRYSNYDDLLRTFEQLEKFEKMIDELAPSGLSEEESIQSIKGDVESILRDSEPVKLVIQSERILWPTL